MTTRKPGEEAPPADWLPTQAVDNPILSGPYDEPKEHWLYREGVPFKVPGRRPASYWFKTQKVGERQQGLFAEEDRDELPLVNRLRADVKRWREAGYRGYAPIETLGPGDPNEKVRRFLGEVREALASA